MIAKKIVLPLLFALAFLIPFVPGRTAGAYSFPDEPLEVTDTLKEKIWARIFTQAQDGEPYYLVVYRKDGLPYIYSFSNKPSFSGYVSGDDDYAVFCLNVPYLDNPASDSTYTTYTVYGLDTSTGTWDKFDKRESESYVSVTARFALWDVPAPVLYDDGSSNVTSDLVKSGVQGSGRFLYSNFSCDFFDGVTVFPRAPLVLNTSLTRKITSGAKEAETEMGKVGTVTVMIAVGSVLLFPFLATFLKRSLHSLLGLPLGSRHGLKK